MPTDTHGVKHDLQTPEKKWFRKRRLLTPRNDEGSKTTLGRLVCMWYFNLAKSQSNETKNDVDRAFKNEEIRSITKINIEGRTNRPLSYYCTIDITLIKN